MSAQPSPSVDGFSREPLPLQRIYVLADGQAAMIETLSLRDSLMAVAPHAGPVRWLRGADARANFLQCAKLAKSVPVRRLRRPSSLDALADLPRVVADDLAHA
jgi:hypothetical protein